MTSIIHCHDVDIKWQSHVTTLINDTTGSSAVNSFALMALLLRHIRNKVTDITRQCCNVLDNSLFGVTSLFVEILEALDIHGHCPYVYLDSEVVRRSKILERLKFMILEIDDHYRSYKEMLHNASRALERLRNVDKRDHSPLQDKETSTSSLEESKYDDCEIALCWALYKLHFQVLLVLDSYSRSFEYLQKQANKYDVSCFSSSLSLVLTKPFSPTYV